MAESHSVFVQGNSGDRSSFAIVTDHLVRGLARHGYQVTLFPNNEAAAVPDAGAPPDIYIFQGFGYDVKNAPGRLNVFFFTYEYVDLERRYAGLVDRVNAYFDLVVVPSNFVRQICLRNRITIPVEVLSHGFEPAEFHPEVPAEPLPTEKKFRFLNLGGIFDRKGTDVLLRAYLNEFTADDDVALVIKARGYELASDWAEQVFRKSGMDRPNAPEVVVVHRDVESVAGYYTAADVGVFPHRGEGFGLPILECLASGTPVITTSGTGEMDYCSPKNARFIESRPRISAGRRQAEPDVASLRALLREAFEKGPLAANARARIAQSVARFTWSRTSRQLDVTLRRAWKSATRKPVQPVQPIQQSTAAAGSVTYCYYVRGRVSWKRCSLEIDALLRRRWPQFFSVPYGAPLPSDPTALVIGQSEFCLESFLRAAALNPDVRRILHQEGTALKRRIAIANRERRRCGVPLIAKRPIELWRNRMECDLADYIVVPSTVSARYFWQAGYTRERVRVMPWGIDIRDRLKRRSGRKLRFLFAGTDPFRKGIRLLLEAWNTLKPSGAELWCYTSEEILQSKTLLRLVIANPSVIVRPLAPIREFQQVMREVDCQVLPSLEDSFSLVIGDGMGCGLPAIVSDETGISELITTGESGLIVKTGSRQQLADAIDWCCRNTRRLREIGDAGYEVARLYPWARFRREFIALTEESLQMPGRVRL